MDQSEIVPVDALINVNAIGAYRRMLQSVMDNLVSNEWLSQHLDDPDLVVVDCMVRSVDAPDGIKDVSSLDQPTSPSHK